MKINILKRIIQEELRKIKKRKVRENTILTEAPENCCTGDSYDGACCAILWDSICCGNPKQDCCDDMEDDKTIGGGGPSAYRGKTMGEARNNKKKWRGNKY